MPTLEPENTVGHQKADRKAKLNLRCAMGKNMTAKRVLLALREVARDDEAAFLPGFFQAVPAGYG